MHALECNYDGIIIGAGHHGLALGAYLAKAGLDILIVERRLDYGGGLCTKEVTEPGFYITTCIPSITSTLARRRGSRTSVSANV